MHQLGDVQSDELIGREPLDVLHRVAHEQNRAVRRHQRQDVGAVFDKSPESALAVAQRLLHAEALLPGPFQLQGPLHRRRQPIEILLEDVVRGTGPEPLGGLLLAQGAGHDDDRNGGRRLADDAQHVRRGELRHDVVAQDDVGEKLPELTYEVLTRRHAAVHDVEPFVAQATGDQLGIFRPVLDVEDPNRRDLRLGHSRVFREARGGWWKGASERDGGRPRRCQRRGCPRLVSC